MIRCARCRRQVSNPVYAAGMALGAKCAAMLAGARPKRKRAASAPDARQGDLFA